MDLIPTNSVYPPPHELGRGEIGGHGLVVLVLEGKGVAISKPCRPKHLEQHEGQKESQKRPEIPTLSSMVALRR